MIPNIFIRFTYVVSYVIKVLNIEKMTLKTLIYYLLMHILSNISA